MADNTVILSGKATIYGGITGSNQGSITGVTLTAMPQISTSENNLTIGGIAGENKNSINNVSAELKFESFSVTVILAGSSDPIRLELFRMQRSPEQSQKRTVLPGIVTEESPASIRQD